MSSKLYKLKEEVKKYLSIEKGKHLELTLEDWDYCGFNKEALDEVKIEKYVSVLCSSEHPNNVLAISTGGKPRGWSREEAELVEYCVGNFKNIKDMNYILSLYESDIIVNTKKIKRTKDFKNWLIDFKKL